RRHRRGARARRARARGAGARAMSRKRQHADPAAEVGVGILGFGYMGRTHLAAYRAANAAGFANRVVALCDPALARTGAKAFALGNLEGTARAPFLDVKGVELVAEAATLFADER